MNEKMLLEEVKNNLVNDLCSLRHTFNREGMLVANDVTILFLSEGVRPAFITCIPDEYENTKIDLRIRKRLAKEFIELYSLDQLKQEYVNRLEREEKQAQEDENKRIELVSLYDAIQNNLSSFRRAEVKSYYSGLVKNEIVCEYMFSDYSYRSVNTIHTVKIQKHDASYKVVHEYSNGFTMETPEYIATTIDELIQNINNVLDTIRIEELAAKARIDAKFKAEERERKINELLREIRMSDNWFILKGKRTYTAISGNTKFSLTSAMGKYVKPNYRNILNDILSGKIESYIEVVDGVRPSKIDFKALEYVAF